MPFSIVDFIILFLLPLIVGQFIFWLLRRTLLKVIERSSLIDKHKSVMTNALRIFFRILSLILFVFLMTLLLGAGFNTMLSALGSALNEPFLKSGDLSISVMTIISAIPVFLIAAWFAKNVHRIVEIEILKRLPIDDSLRFSVSNIIRYSLMLLLIIVGLSIIGINLSSLLLMFGVLGIGIGFGLQSTMANFFAGLIIIMSRPIKEGDFILANSSGEVVEGSVVTITLLHSIINTPLNETIIVPNSDIINKTVHNLSYNNTEVVVRVNVEVHYETDIENVEQVLSELSRKCPYWNGKDEATVMIRNFASSGIEMGLYLRILQANERFKATAWLRKQIWRSFKDRGIVIPYPQLDLHLIGEREVPDVQL